MINNLNAKQLRFVESIVKGLSPKEAAVLSGYSQRSAHQTASRLLNDPDISGAIRDARTKESETLSNLERARKLAMQNDDASAAIRAIEIEATIRGLIHDN